MEDRLLIQGNLSEKRIERHSGEIYLRTQFLYNHPANQLVLLVWDETRSFHLDKVLTLDTNDKIALLAAINKDNNRIKNMMEESKRKEYKTPTIEPYCDSIRSKELRDGIMWEYIKDDRITDTAFMSYKQLYKIQIAPSTSCQFCDATETTKFMPRMNDTAIYLCEQHEKYIQRVSEKKYGN